MKIKHLLFMLLLLSFARPAKAQFIGEKTYHYKDTTRNRSLVTEVWYPTADTGRNPAAKEDYPFITEPTIRNAQLPVQKHPLIMISHGTGGGRMTLEWLADTLVKQGFMVAAVDHWGNTYDHKIAIDFVTPWQRAQDISYVLTQLLADGQLEAVIDQARIGAAGFSIGGYTVIALAGAKLDINALNRFATTPEGIRELSIPEFPDLAKSIDKKAVQASFDASPPLKDKRIKAFFAVCPAIGQGFTKRSQFKDVKDPVYIIGAESDRIAPVKTNASHYHQLIPKSKLYVVPGKAGHYVFLNEPIEALKQSGQGFFTDDFSVDRHAVHQLIGGMAVKFFEEALAPRL